MTTDTMTYAANLGAWLTEAELARHWRVSARTLQRWRVAGTGPGWLRLNGRILYARRDILEFEDVRRLPGSSS
jgi:transcriptional regulator GlxA family with amidase domain